MSFDMISFFKAKAEERKLLSQRTESHEESDLDDEPKENQQFNKESKPKDKPERLDKNINACLVPENIHTPYRKDLPCDSLPHWKFQLSFIHSFKFLGL